MDLGVVVDIRIACPISICFFMITILIYALVSTSAMCLGE